MRLRKAARMESRSRVQRTVATHILGRLRDGMARLEEWRLCVRWYYDCPFGKQGYVVMLDGSGPAVWRAPAEEVVVRQNKTHHSYEGAILWAAANLPKRST